MSLSADLLDRISAALDAGAATPTDVLQGLLLAAGGEKCWQRGRLLFRLSTILTAQRPVMATSKTHRFKAAFSGKNFTGFPLVTGSTTKIVTAHNLTDEDVPLLQRNGGAHLLEPIPASEEAVDAGSDTQAEPSAPAGEPTPEVLVPSLDYEKLVSDVADLVLSRIQEGTVADLTTDEVRTTNSGILQTATEQDGDSTTVKHSTGGPDDLPITAPAAMQAQVVTPNQLPDTQPEPEDLHKLLKPALQARYKTVKGKDAPADMLKEDLIKAIEAGPDKA
jgi:hypothetical protein